MRAVLHGFHEAWQEPVLERVVKRLGIERCHVTCGAFRPHLPGTSCVAHDWRDLNWGHYPTDPNDQQPLDAPLLEALAETESLVMKMFDRLDPVRSSEYQTRKSLYLAHVRYWNHVILTEGLDAYVMLNVPHEMFDYVLYALCRHHGIPTVIAFQTQVADTILVLEDWRNFSASLRPALDAARREYAQSTEDEIPLVPRCAREFATQTGARAPTPFYMNLPAAPPPPLVGRVRDLAQHALGVAAKATTAGVSDWLDGIGARLRQREHARRGEAMRETYERLAREPDLTRPFIYLPLHYQPEMTTSPLAGPFVDQVLIAQALAATMPPHVHLYVKEHPKQVDFAGRSDGYYEALARLPRTTLVPKTFDTYTLLDACAAIATATGTAGWEALFRAKPVLLFGHIFYECATGVYRVGERAQLRSAMKAVFDDGAKPTRRDAKLFLHALGHASHEGYLWEIFKGVSAIAPSTNEENMVALLCSAVKRTSSARRIA